MNNNIKKNIALFDSGIGGLTVFKKIVELLPLENYIYLGDTKNLPYGDKTQEELIIITKKILDFFATQNTKAVIIACNTTSATAFDALKDNYNFKIYPIIQTAATNIVKTTDIKQFGVFATPATISSNKYKIELLKNDPNIKIHQHACKNWVNMVENNNYNLPENLEILKKDLQELTKYNCKNIILGCTHYPYLKETLRKLADYDINFIDPANNFVNEIIKDLKVHNLINNEAQPFQKFYVTANPEKFRENAKLFYNIEKLPTLIKL